MTEKSGTGVHRGVRSYVLRGGRLSKGQQRALDHLFDEYSIPFRDHLIDISDLRGHPGHRRGTNKIIVEIGFGMGDATAAIADDHPQTMYIGIEVFLAGIGGLLSQIEKRELGNITIIRHDAVEVLQSMIPDGWISGFHIFFPDPWPKKKHHKRRLIQPEFAALLARKLREEGYIYAVTDWEAYGEQMLTVFSCTRDLVNPFAEKSISGYSTPMSWRPRTKFEKKGIDKSHTVCELYFVKKSDASACL